MEIKGIDVSSYQYRPDWKKVAASGTKFAILRITEKWGADQSFEHNYQGCMDNGILVGVYRFSYALTTVQAREEAREVLAVLNGRRLDFPVFYDMEWADQQSLGKADLTAIVTAFADEITQAGYRFGVYTTEHWYNTYLDGPNMPYDFWFASYPYEDQGQIVERLRPKIGVGWQYSSKGQVDGIAGYVDMDVFYRDYKEDNTMSAIDTAVQMAVAIANDNSHGYDQIFRWGEKGDYDCSSLLITAWQTAGVPVKTYGATYTGNMYSAFTKCGFKDVTAAVNLSTGAGLKKGDVLLNHVHHTAMMVDGGKLVQASINEQGSATGGTPGDQTGREIRVRSYYNYPWDCVLRYPDNAQQGIFERTNSGTCTGDQVNIRSTPEINGWNVVGQLNSGNRFDVDENQSVGNWLRVSVLGIGVGWMYVVYAKLDSKGTAPGKKKAVLTDKLSLQLPVIQKGYTGTAVSMLQAMLGVTVDGQFGDATAKSLNAFKGNVKLPKNGICDGDTWRAVVEHMKANTFK